MSGKTSDQSISPAGFGQNADGAMVNPATGQSAKWDGGKGAWVDSATGKPIPRKETISAASPAADGVAAVDGSCEALRRAASWAYGLAQAYTDELAHSDSVVESELMNVADITREVKDMIAKDKDLAQLALETGFLGTGAAAGASMGASAVAGTPVYAATGEFVGYVAGSTVGAVVLIPLAGLIVGTSAGLAVRNIWDAADRKVEFKRALDLLDKARGRMAFFLEHSAALRIAAVDASARYQVAAAALSACEETARKEDPCRNEKRWVFESDGYIEGLRRVLEAVRAVLSAASDALARADAAAQASAASFERGIVRAATLEVGRLERLMTEAQEERAKRAKVLKDCGDKDMATPPETPAKAGADGASNKNKILIGAIIVAVGGTLFGLSVVGGKPPSASPSPPPTVAPTRPATAAPTTSPSPSPVSAACGAAGALLELGGSSDAATANQLCDLLRPDAAGDWVEATGARPEVQLASSDMLKTAIFETPLTPTWADHVRALCAQSGSDVACAGEVKPVDHIAVVIELAGPAAPADSAFWEAGVGFGGPDARWQSALIADVLRDQSTVYSLRFGGGAVSGPFRLVFDTTQPAFHDIPSGSFAYHGENVIALFMPATEWSGAQDYRFFTYFEDQTVNKAAVDLAPDHDQSPTTFAPASLPVIDLPQPALERVPRDGSLLHLAMPVSFCSAWRWLA